MATNSPTSSYGTFLLVNGLSYKKETQEWEAKASTYEKLIDIKDYPDLGGSPELLDTTTLSDKMATHIFGIESTDTLNFTANYTLDDLIKLEKLEDYIADHEAAEFEIWFCPRGLTSTPSVSNASDGRFKFKGTISSYVIGKGVNEVKEIAVSIANTTVIETVSA